MCVNEVRLGKYVNDFTLPSALRVKVEVYRSRCKTGKISLSIFCGERVHKKEAFLIT